MFLSSDIGIPIYEQDTAALILNFLRPLAFFDISNDYFTWIRHLRCSEWALADNQRGALRISASPARLRESNFGSEFEYIILSIHQLTKLSPLHRGFLSQDLSVLQLGSKNDKFQQKYMERTQRDYCGSPRVDTFCKNVYLSIWIMMVEDC